MKSLHLAVYTLEWRPPRGGQQKIQRNRKCTECGQIGLRTPKTYHSRVIGAWSYALGSCVRVLKPAQGAVAYVVLTLALPPGASSPRRQWRQCFSSHSYSRVLWERNGNGIISTGIGIHYGEHFGVLVWLWWDTQLIGTGRGFREKTVAANIKRTLPRSHTELRPSAIGEKSLWWTWEWN